MRTKKREAEIADFLAKAGWGEAKREALAADASFRSYDRLTRPNGSAVLMDAPPPEQVGPFQKIARTLCNFGFSAPRIFASDVERGLLLLEDLGDRTFARQLAEGADERALYLLGTETIIQLQTMLTPLDLETLGVPDYDEEAYLEELRLFTKWYLPTAGPSPRPKVRNAFEEAWKEVLRPVLKVPSTLVLRDFHIDNLIELPDRRGVARCGLLDFQDAAAGHPVYDLVSLLEDARRDVSPAVVIEMRARFAGALPAARSSEFEPHYPVLAAQRATKILGIFSRLAQRDGKEAYLAHIPRVWSQLERQLDDPALAPVAAWMEEHVRSPAQQRTTAA